MSRARRHGIFALAIATSIAIAYARPPSAHAETPPNAWDCVIHPERTTRYAYHLRAREALLMSEMRETPPVLKDSALERARTFLEEAISSANDVSFPHDEKHAPLRLDSGEVYYHLHYYERAIGILTKVLSEQSDSAESKCHPATIQATRQLAYAYAQLGRATDERDTYRRLMQCETNDYVRALTLLNLAEAEMHTGDLEAAVERYKDSIDVATLLPADPKTLPLAVWGLAVALDRAGDNAASSAQTRLAVQLDPESRLIERDPTVFFVPDYERLWYVALGTAEHARQAKDSRTRADLWYRVSELWNAYVLRATSKDRWVRLAERHRESARREFHRLVKSPPKAR